MTEREFKKLIDNLLSTAEEGAVPMGWYDQEALHCLSDFMGGYNGYKNWNEDEFFCYLLGIQSMLDADFDIDWELD